MTEKTYEEPEIRVLGEVTDLTQMAKPGTFFDFPFSSEGNTTRFPHHELKSFQGCPGAGSANSGQANSGRSMTSLSPLSRRGACRNSKATT